jgi:hypothetical protein
MTYSLAVRPDAPLAAILASLQRLRAREVLLKLPLGKPSLLADETALHQLALFCQHAGKDLAIIGGDETLRARAVAAGFVVATSPEDHEQRAARHAIRRHSNQPWEDAYAQFAARRGARPLRPRRRDDEPLLDEPPEYVRRLLEEQPALHAVLGTPHTAAMQRARRTTRKLPTVADEDRVRDAYESDEDFVTETIRTTGKLGQSAHPAHLSLLPRACSDSWPASTDGLS